MRRLILIFAALPLAAEFRSIEIGAGGLDCASCAGSVERALKRIRGVESASFRLADATALVALKPGNTATIEQVRDALKGIGYTPQDAKVVVRGVAEERGFRIAGLERRFKLEGTAPPRDREATVEGTVAASAPDTLRVSRIVE